jgi:folate-binding protein YgfZ
MATSTTEPAAVEQFFDQTVSITHLDDFPQAVITLDNLSCIEISGPESEDFLQSQFANDVSTLQPDSYQLNAYCNPKGRVIAVFRLLKTDDTYNLLLPSDIAPVIIQRLQMYKMRAKVEIVLAEDTTLIGAINLDLEYRNPSCRFLSVDQNRTIVVADHASANEILHHHGAQSVESEVWRISEIVSGTPQVYTATSEEFIPQHINLDLISAVSFSKGCYPGQEIVARLRYLGKMKQRMIAGTVQDKMVIEPGQSVYTTERAEQKSGSVVEAVQCGSIYYVLCTVPSNYVRLREPSGPVVHHLPLPYPITLGKS